MVTDDTVTLRALTVLYGGINRYSLTVWNPVRRMLVWSQRYVATDYEPETSMMKSTPHRLMMNTSRTEPMVDQGTECGWTLSWCPDDGRFHVANANGDSVATFRDFRNAVRYARTH